MLSRSLLTSSGIAHIRLGWARVAQHRQFTFKFKPRRPLFRVVGFLLMKLVLMTRIRVYIRPV